MKKSIVVAVMNRNEILREGIHNWLSLDIADEIIVVDWSSNNPFTFDHDKVKVFRVEGEKTWALSAAYNLATQLSSGEIIIKMDSDYRLDDRIFDAVNSVKRKVFIQGDWRLAKIKNDTYINGFMSFHREDFNEIGGYHEGIVTYGYDDTDLSNRLSENGCKLIGLSVDNGINHKPHPDEMRLSNQSTKKSPSELIDANQALCIRDPWSKSSIKIKWDINGQSIVRSKNQIERKLLVIKPKNGLCNRLRVLSSSWALANLFHKKLCICWEEGEGFSDEKFSDLFANHFNFITEEEFESYKKIEKAVFLNDHIVQNDDYEYVEVGGFCRKTFWNNLNSFEYPVIFEGSDNLLSFLDKWSLKSFADQNLIKLKPVREIQTIVDNFVKDNFDNNVIGVHIRRGDAWTCHYNFMYMSSTDEVFEKAMNEEIKKNDKVKFFIASDCEKTFLKFKNLFPDRVIEMSSKKYVESIYQEAKLNQRGALIDLLLLSRTKKILGSKWSSFTSTAAVWGNAELKICKED